MICSYAVIYVMIALVVEVVIAVVIVVVVVVVVVVDNIVYWSPVPWLYFGITCVWYQTTLLIPVLGGVDTA
jgi:hypothetical protein